MKGFILFYLFFLLNTYAIGQLTAAFDNVWVPMRDGDSLQADVYIPTGLDSAEVILIQTPYNKESFANSLPMGVGLGLDAQPFIWVIVDWRGFYGSSGADLSNFTRGEDGFDVCEWITQQTWHRDRIGTWGPSALGGVQYATAREQHPNHTCAVPIVAHPQNNYQDYFYGGVYEEGRIETLDLLGYGLSAITLANPYYSVVWQFAESGSWYPQDIVIPTLQIGGWYDHNITIMMEWYDATRTSAAAAVQDQQWLLIGPWVHGGPSSAYVGSSNQGELFYPNAAQVSDTMAWAFLEYYLLDSMNGWELTDKITYYQTGKDTWTTSNASSIETMNIETLFLNGNHLEGNPGNETRTYVSDPDNPVPTLGGATLNLATNQGPVDMSSLDVRNDVLTYHSYILENDVQISGRVKANLYLESDQPDCDVVVSLVDEYPDGRSMLITDGIRRVRFRNGYTQADEAFMNPGTVYQVDVNLPFTNYTWKQGHRIKIYIAPSSSNRWDVNLQNGGTMYTPGSSFMANIAIQQNSSYPSSIQLPTSNPTLLLDDKEKVTTMLYPNPVEDKLKIISDMQFQELMITDVHGAEVKRIGSDDSIDVRNLEPGVYFIWDKRQQFRAKFIKN